MNDYLKNLMASAGFVSNFTNHSLRATTATRLFESDCPDKLIAEQTGHSSNAIRRYKKANLKQKEHVSNLLAKMAGSASVAAQSVAKCDENAAKPKDSSVDKEQVHESVQSDPKNLNIDV